MQAGDFVVVRWNHDIGLGVISKRDDGYSEFMYLYEGEMLTDELPNSRFIHVYPTTRFDSLAQLDIEHDVAPMNKGDQETFLKWIETKKKAQNVAEEVFEGLNE